MGGCGGEGDVRVNVQGAGWCGGGGGGGEVVCCMGRGDGGLEGGKSIGEGGIRGLSDERESGWGG